MQRRIESLLAQTAARLELILLDDASTDGTSALLRQWEHHPAVQTICSNTVNSGSPFLQWQQGLGLAQQEWVWIAEGDDYCDPDFVAQLLPALQEPDCVLAYNEIRWVNKQDQLIKPGHKQHARWYDSTEFLAHHMMLQDDLVNSGMLLFRRSALQSIPPRWTEMKQAGDYLLWVQIAAQGKVYASGSVQAAFVRHSQSLSLQQLCTPVHLLESMEIQDWMVQHAGVSKQLQQHYFEQQLIQLHTSARHWPTGDYEAAYRFWQAEAESRDIQITDWRIRRKAFAAKLRHFLQKSRQ